MENSYMNTCLYQLLKLSLICDGILWLINLFLLRESCNICVDFIFVKTSYDPYILQLLKSQSGFPKRHKHFEKKKSEKRQVSVDSSPVSVVRVHFLRFQNNESSFIFESHFIFCYFSKNIYSYTVYQDISFYIRFFSFYLLLFTPVSSKLSCIYFLQNFSKNHDCFCVLTRKTKISIVMPIYFRHENRPYVYSLLISLHTS